MLKSAPCTARSEPTDSTERSRRSLVTGAVLTVSTGGPPPSSPEEINLPIWSAFTPATTPTTTRRKAREKRKDFNFMQERTEDKTYVLNDTDALPCHVIPPANRR